MTKFYMNFVSIRKIKDDKFMVLYIEDILLIWNDICYVNYKNMACKTI